MILSIDELEGKTLDYAFEKAKAYSEGYEPRGRGHFRWPIKDGVMLDIHERNTYASPDLDPNMVHAMVLKHVGELVVVPTDLCSPAHAHARHRRQKDVRVAEHARQQLLAAREQ